MNLKMSIKSIVLFEKMTNIPFSDLSFTEQSILNNPDVFLKLLYCILISHPENQIKYTFEGACEQLFTEQNLVLYSTFLSNEIALMNQFVDSKLLKDVNTDILEDHKEEKEHKSVYMKNLVPILILDCGLDADFVLNELNYTDIDDYLKYREDKHKNDLEEKRLFTYLTISPHIDTKKCKTPEKLLPFPWEKADRKNKAEDGIKNVRDRLLELGILKKEEEDL